MVIKGCEGHKQGLAPESSWRGREGGLTEESAGFSEKVTLENKEQARRRWKVEGSRQRKEYMQKPEGKKRSQNI